MQANERLHQLIVSVGSSATAARMLEQLQLPKVRTLFFRATSPVICRASRDDPLAMLTPLIAGDADRAEKALRRHERKRAVSAKSGPVLVDMGGSGGLKTKNETRPQHWKNPN